MKRLFLIAVFVVVGLLLGRGVQFYLQNTRYAHYIITSYFDGLHSIVKDGYTDRQSYTIGEQQQVYMNADEASEEIVRLYDVLGNVVDSVSTVLAPQEPQANPSEAGFGYTPTFFYHVPALKSGLYLWENKIPFIVKSKAAPVVVLYPTNTINAYTISGGKSLYDIFSEQTHQVSFHRPTFPAVSFQVKPAMAWLVESAYQIKYIVDSDLEDSTVLSGAKVLVIIGHSEYWTRNARKTVDAFVAKGGHSAVLSGNTMWWQARYTPDGSGLICYKIQPDPIQNPLLKTINWYHEELQYPIVGSIGVDLRFGGYGRKRFESFGGFKIVNEKSPLLKGTNLRNGDVLRVPSKELDGTFLVKSPEEVVLDTAQLGFFKAELLGYEHAYLDDWGYGSFLIFQKTPTSGVVVNVASMDWCSPYGIGGDDAARIKIITKNILDGLLQDEDMFSK
ncbi:hypothetical protein MKJ04_22325 [Pontibacter sp. E15-1]|uniref:N,N-dimethylformamidase beta subunit family domain-containing protein n=1 Tax=Pontibacter sp. E15-1 TaxID=2919918 RepID=UPI001F4F9B81|nr:N,N-dimethylformamidase beta subunit family domain-containing protein [Pontibacter sp. E15-1]MCJ8167596.1 hypothetical protein [Pontibacter sp. E15-1]